MSTDFVKQTLRENLARVLIPHVADGLWSIYDNAKIACDRNKQPEQTLRTFQNLLTRIPTWTEETLDAEVERIATASKCDYIEDLLLGVFVSYIRAFAALQQLEDTHVDVHFERPSVSKFIHALYKTAARSSWSNAYLFKTIGVTSEQQARNRRDIEAMISNNLNEVIDAFIPWKDISKAYFRVRDTPAAPLPEPVVEAPIARAPTPAPKPVTFGEDEVREFDNDSDDDDAPPRLQLGEDIQLDNDEDDDKASVNTQDELEAKTKAAEVVSLNL
jgi:hypothetical protein